MKCCCSFCYELSDLPETHDAQSFLGKLYALKLRSVPAPANQVGMSLGNVAGLGENQTQSVLGCGNGVGSGRIHHHDASSRGSFGVHIVDSDAGPCDDLQLLGGCQHFFCDLRLRTHDERIAVGHGS